MTNIVYTQPTLAEDAVKAIPTAAVVGLSLFGVQLSDALLLLTLIYTVIQLYFTLRDKWWRQRCNCDETDE